MTNFEYRLRRELVELADALLKDEETTFGPIEQDMDAEFAIPRATCRALRPDLIVGGWQPSQPACSPLQGSDTWQFDSTVPRRWCSSTRLLERRAASARGTRSLKPRSTRAPLQPRRGQVLRSCSGRAPA